MHTEYISINIIKETFASPLSKVIVFGTNSMELSPTLEAPVAQLLENFSIFYGTRSFITMFTRAL
jgi:hypothetical protein